MIGRLVNLLGGAIEDPSSGGPSASRFGVIWCLVVLTPVFIWLACKGWLPPELAMKWDLGLLAAPALVYAGNSAARVWRNGNGKSKQLDESKAEG